MRLTASRFGLASLCTYWARPDIPAPTVEPKSRPATVGTALHKAIECRLLKQAPPPMDRLTKSEREMVLGCMERFVEHRISRVAWVPEQGFAYNPAEDTARMLPTTGHRDYSDLREGEVPGTPDAYFHDAAKSAVYVPDWKTGLSNEDGRASAFAQGDFNALMVARAFKASRAFVYAIRLTPDELIEDNPRELTPADLNAIAANVRHIVASIPDAEPQPGLHCQSSYCPQRGTCPSTTRWQAALVPMKMGQTLTFDPQTPEHYATAIEAVRALEAMAEWLKASVDAKVDDLPGQGVQLPDGRWYVRSETPKRSIDLTVAGAEAAIVAKGLGAAITHEVTLGALAKASGLKGAAAKAVVDQLFAELEHTGAAVSTMQVSHSIKGKRGPPAVTRAELEGE